MYQEWAIHYMWQPSNETSSLAGTNDSATLNDSAVGSVVYMLHTHAIHTNTANPIHLQRNHRFRTICGERSTWTIACFFYSTAAGATVTASASK